MTKTKEVLCHKCREDLRKAGVGYAQEGTMYFNYTKGEKYEEDEFQSNGGGEFYCQNCGYYLGITDPSEIDKLL